MLRGIPVGNGDEFRVRAEMLHEATRPARLVERLMALFIADRQRRNFFMDTAERGKIKESLTRQDTFSTSSGIE